MTTNANTNSAAEGGGAAIDVIEGDSSNETSLTSIRALLRGLPSLQGPYTHLIDWSSSPPTPQETFGKWLADAVAVAQSEAGSLLPCEPHAMTVSTVDAEGRPDARVLILKNVDHRGWHFAANAGSRKGHQLTSSQSVALTFYWSPLARQVRIRGQAVLLSPEECAADFLARPLSSRISAIASLQSEVMDAEGERKFAESTREAKKLLEEQPNYTPPSWLVFAVAPSEVEFWQGATDRKHQRLRYVWVSDNKDSAVADGTSKGRWVKERLWP